MSHSNKIPDKGLNLSCRRFKTEIATLDSFVSAKELLNRHELKIGDIVEIDRIIYSHWALYVGEDEVVHVTGPISDIATTTSAHVARCRLQDVAGESLVRVNNKSVRAKERGVLALSADAIVKNALRSVGRTVNYNFLTRNSEHYVTEWRYDSSWSDEADTASHAMTVFSSSPVLQDDPEEAHRTMQVGITNILHSPTHNHSPTSPIYYTQLPKNEHRCDVTCRETNSTPAKMCQNSHVTEPSRTSNTSSDERLSKPPSVFKN